jgi:hypothetical protein
VVLQWDPTGRDTRSQKSAEVVSVSENDFIDEIINRQNLEREVWEEAVKEVRTEMLNKTHDPEYRRQVAAVIDAFSDKLHDEYISRKGVLKI